MEKVWTDVDSYFAGLLHEPDAALEAAVAATAEAGMPAIAVSPAQGKFLHLLARATGARRVLEIGTLGGYSTIWLARAVPPDGRVVTLEIDPRHAEVARRNLARAGVGARVDLRVAPAQESLRQLAADRAAGRAEPFDVVFIDADKPSTAAYFDASLRLSRPGTVIVIDNVVRGGKVSDAAGADEDARGIREAAERLSREPRVTATALQTVGVKGYDGFIVALVTQ